jgi:hypothetical protein
MNRRYPPYPRTPESWWGALVLKTEEESPELPAWAHFSLFSEMQTDCVFQSFQFALSFPLSPFLCLFLSSDKPKEAKEKVKLDLKIFFQFQLASQGKRTPREIMAVI